MVWWDLMLASGTTSSLLVTGTIWAALVLYVAGEFGRSLRPRASWARPVWILGSICYVCHVISAFSLHHHWSHSAAYVYTAATTNDLVGINSGLGLWVNYVFTAVWVGEGLLPRRWSLPVDRRLNLIVRSVFLFMIINGAVVFVAGPQRWFGLLLVVGLFIIWWDDTETSSE